MGRSQTANHESLHDAVRERVRGAGQLYTAGRQLLVELLAETDRPVTVPELMAARPDVALSSAYRNFVVLEQVGVVTRILSGEHARFELTEDVRGDHHHHLICSTCGRVDDFTVPGPVERSLERALAKAVQGSSFTPSSHRLDLLGTCGDCANNH